MFQLEITLILHSLLRVSRELHCLPQDGISKEIASPIETFIHGASLFQEQITFPAQNSSLWRFVHSRDFSLKLGSLARLIRLEHWHAHVCW